MKAKGKLVEGVFDVMSAFVIKDGYSVRLMAIPPSDEPPKPLTFYRKGDRVFMPKKKRGERFKVIYTVLAEMEF
jgi:hypothetical protein